MKIKELNTIVDHVLTEEVKRQIKEDMGGKRVFHIKCNGEPIDSFESEEEANDNLDKYKKEHPGKQLIIEPGEYESYDHMIDKLDEMGEILDMKNKLKESKKSIIVTESQMKTIIKSLISEDVPGVEVTKKAQAGSKKDAANNLKDVETKLKKAAKFDGNDNPEFPKQIGGEKKASYANAQEVKEIEDNDNRGTQDLDYDREPSAEFKKREKMYLQGDQKTGNSQDAANVVKSDLGKKLADRADRKIKAHKDRTLYAKEFQPVKTAKDNLSEDNVKKDIQRMKEMFSYNEKTQ